MKLRSKTKSLSLFPNTCLMTEVWPTTLTGPRTVMGCSLPSGEGHGAGGEVEGMGSKTNISAIRQGRDHSAECPYKKLCGSACRTAAEDYASNS